MAAKLTRRTNTMPLRRIALMDYWYNTSNVFRISSASDIDDYFL